MEKIKSIAIGIFLLVAGTTISNAQVNENQPKGSHNGIIQNAGDYKIEMIERENNCSFYVIDAKGKTVSNKGVTGMVVFEFFNKTKATNAISLDKNNALFVEVPRANVYTYCTFSAIVKGKTVSAKFKNSQISQQDINHGHQH
jgi:hypothetical protein